jgi:hypothetical protein
MKIRYLLAVVAVALVALFGFSACSSLEGACSDCCKERMTKLRKQGILSSQEAYAEREICTKLCVENAKAQGKEPDWVERNRACD